MARDRYRQSPCKPVGNTTDKKIVYMEYGKALNWLTVTVIQFMYYYAVFELTWSSKTMCCQQFNGQCKHILAAA